MPNKNRPWEDALREQFIGEKVVRSFRGQAHVPEEILRLEDSLCDQYLCNFSVFQSLLDHWALGQLFPIMPIHRLNEPPTIPGTLVDITCDSDGKVSEFTDLTDVREALPVHALKHGAPYYLGFFMTGAYHMIATDSGEAFDVAIPAFSLDSPHQPSGRLH